MAASDKTVTRDLEAKIVVVGAQGVGKTSLLARFIHNHFAPPGTVPSTVGASFLTKRLHSPDHPDTTIRLQLWDTAGQERFRSISRLYYRGANAALLCYDITDAASFHDMQRWLKELRENLAPDAVLHVVGNKADVAAEDPSSRQVPFEECIKYVAEHINTARPGSAAGLAAVKKMSPASTSTKSSAAASTAHSGPHDSPPSLFAMPGLASPSIPESHPSGRPSLPSMRSSGYWAFDAVDTAASWDCCHEISAKDGEGVEEVFRVIARKLVEQRTVREQAATEQQRALALLGGGRSRGEMAEVGAGLGTEGSGSFRLARGDKRRSWFGFEVPVVAVPVGGGRDGGGGSGGAQEMAGRVKRSGRCC